MLIIKQGELCKGVFFVKGGMVKLVQQVQFKVNKDGAIKDDYKDPQDEKIKKGQYKNLLVEIDEIGNGGYFGELISNKKQI